MVRNFTVSNCGETPIRQVQREESWLMPAFEITDGPSEKRIRDSLEYLDDHLASVHVVFAIRQSESSWGDIVCRVVGVQRMNMDPSQLLVEIEVLSNPLFGTVWISYDARLKKGHSI